MRTKEERRADHERREAARKATYARRMNEIHAKAQERKADHERREAARRATYAERQEPGKDNREDKRAAQDAAIAARGEELLTLGGTCKGRYRYHADGTVTYNDSATDNAKKDRVVGNLHDGWDAAYELSARGPTAFQSSGGEAYGADGFVTVQLGDYVKVHKIETLFAGGGSKVHTRQREACIRSNILARKFSASASIPAVADVPEGLPVQP